MIGIKLGCALAPMLLLSSCAGLNDSYKDYTVAYEKHMETDSNRMTKQTEAIMGSGEVTGATQTEVMLMQVIKTLAVASIKPSVFSLTQPTTAYDVAKAVVGIIPGVTSTLGMVAVVDRALGEIGDEIYSSEGGDINVEKTEVHTTAIGDGNTMSTSYSNVGDEVGTTTDPYVPPSDTVPPGCYWVGEELICDE